MLVPKITPEEKIDVIESYGANVIVKGEYYYDSYKLVESIARQKKLINISPGFADRWKGDRSIGYKLRSHSGFADAIYIAHTSHNEEFCRIVVAEDNEHENP